MNYDYPEVVSIKEKDILEVEFTDKFDDYLTFIDRSGN